MGREAEHNLFIGICGQVRSGRLHMEQRIYEAWTARMPLDVPGRMIDARPEDRDLLIDRVDAFNAEVGERIVTGAEAVSHRLAEGWLVLWWDGDEPVSPAGHEAPSGVQQSLGEPGDARSCSPISPTQRRTRSTRRWVTNP